MYSKIMSAAINGINASLVEVEVDISNGLPTFIMVGSLGSEVKESKDRVIAALKNANFPVPPSKLTVSMSPADVRKEGNYYDLPIAIGILVSSEIIPYENVSGRLFVGELGLNGEVKAVKGVLPIVRWARENGIKECIVPIDNCKEGSIVPGVKVRGASCITQVFEFLSAEDETIMPVSAMSAEQLLESVDNESELDFDQIIGQEGAVRAATISAAGFHSLLFSGPPGVGKSMIAKRIPTIMPPLTLDESLELTSIHSIAGTLKKEDALITKRVFQNPHHTISEAALLGGGGVPRPGAVSLAHRSVLFLDEFTEFDSRTINSLRQPIETHMVSISRARFTTTYPADFLLVCAMNPCPCGYYPDRNRCRCSEPQIRRYLGKISGPIMDRIDLFATLKNLDISEIETTKKGVTSRMLRDQITIARQIQAERYKGSKYRFNSDIDGNDIKEFCPLTKADRAYMEDIYKKLGLSARSYHRILRVARTIADMEEAKDVARKHLLEAVFYRPDMEYFKP